MELPVVVLPVDGAGVVLPLLLPLESDFESQPVKSVPAARRVRMAGVNFISFIGCQSRCTQLELHAHNRVSTAIRCRGSCLATCRAPCFESRKPVGQVSRKIATDLQYLGQNCGYDLGIQSLMHSSAHRLAPEGCAHPNSCLKTKPNIMTDPHETFISWLKDAYAFERKLAPELKAHASQAQEHPEIQSKLEQHLAETEAHAETVKRIIEELGGEVSSVKTAMGEAAGAMLGMSTGLAEDRVVKNALAEFTMEHTEIASYVSLLAAAEHLGLPQVIPPLRAILREEEEMAEWLRMQISRVTIHHLQHEAMAAA